MYIYLVGVLCSMWENFLWQPTMGDFIDDATSEVSNSINSLAENSQPLHNWRPSVLCAMRVLNLAYIRIFYCGHFIFPAVTNGKTRCSIRDVQNGKILSNEELQKIKYPSARLIYSFILLKFNGNTPLIDLINATYMKT